MLHPLRVQILARLKKGPASPRQLADALEEDISKVAYHVRVLHQANCIELVDERRVRGAVEHFYRRITRPWFRTDRWDDVPPWAKEPIVSQILAMMCEEAYESVGTGRFEARADRHISRSPLRLDEQGWKEVVELTDRLLDEAHRVEVESLERMAGEPEEDSIPASLHIVFFESAPGPETASIG